MTAAVAPATWSEGELRGTDERPPPPPVAYAVVHALPGRVRLRVPALRAEPGFAARVVAFLARQDGVASARANVACASLVVEFDPARVPLVKLGAWLAVAADQTETAPAHRAPAKEPTQRNELLSLACGVAAVGLGLLGAPVALTVGCLAAAAVPIVARAAAALVGERRLTVDLLDTIAIGALSLQGDLAAAGVAAALIAGGELIRGLTARRSRAAVSGLLRTAAEAAWVVRRGRLERCRPDELVPGDVVVARAGDLVPVDGVVLGGRALVDQRALTGESVPVPKEQGDAAYAATLVVDGELRLRAERTGAATRAQRIVELLESGPLQDTRTTDHARRFAERLVGPTLLLAGGTLALTRNLARAASILIFEFATGIRVSAPTTVLAAMTAAVRRDVLVKGGRALEQLARVDAVVFDKTGTLTAGRPEVVCVRSFDERLGMLDVLALAAAAEQGLTHPAAQAVARAAAARELLIPERGESDVAIGLGVRAVVDGREVVVGRAAYLARLGVKVPRAAAATASWAARRGASTAFVARDGCVVGMVGYADPPRPEARDVVEGLRARGLRRLVVVTGDNAAVAASVARQVGIADVEAEVFPERKVEVVRELQAAGHVVAVVGDGINDSPALAHADVSVSLREGADVARETADVVLHGDLHGLPTAIDLARDAMRVLRQNLALVAVPNAVGMALATVGAAGPLLATALNNGSAVAAAVNGLRPLMRPGQPLAAGGAV